VSDALFFGWVNNPKEVERLLPTLPMPLAQGNLPDIRDDKEVFLWDYVRSVTGGQDVPKGPQKIGDCVSWGWSNLDNYVACLQIYKALKRQSLLVEPDKDLFGGTEREFNELVALRAAILEEYQPCASEVIYALSRVEVGGQRGSMSDGSTGIWASKAVSTYGTISRAQLEKILGPGKGAYDPNRAKQWGAQGLPDDLEPEAKKHRIKTVSLVRNFREAATLIQNGYPVAVCSDQGFSMTRDQQGFARPQGTWNHCMLFCGVRFDRPGLACSQSWGPNVPNGPTDKGQPDNTFFVDEKVVDRMLGQQDSFTGSEFDGYPAQDLIDWKH
jgi:hypothetical protein